jgi:hypothetical protein
VRAAHCIRRRERRADRCAGSLVSATGADGPGQDGLPRRAPP